MDKKITKRQVITEMLNITEIKANETFTNFLKHELELLDKKSENKKPSKSRQESDSLLDAVIEVLRASEKGMTVTEIIKSSEDFKDCSTQRMTSILNRIEGIKKEVIKGKSYYSLTWG